MFRTLILGALLMTCTIASAEWTEWPPRDYLVESLVSGVQTVLNSQDPATGRFGTQPWICTDQNVLLPLAAAWAIEHEKNPWYHNEKLLEAIGKGGNALVDDQDAKGMWIFRKKDNSTWGQIHMPWTYSRWIRAYALVRDALPPEVRAKWEKGLLLGFEGIRRYADGSVHNIPTHHAMSLYIAGECFGKDDWKDAARKFMAKVVAKQDPTGYWSEHFGPVVGYNEVYVEAFGAYYHFSRDDTVLGALERSAAFHSKVLLPDGSAIGCIDERQIYHAGVEIGNVGFSWTADGRGYLLKQLWRYSNGGKKLLGADYAAQMLLYGGSGPGNPPPAGADKAAVVLGNNEAVIQRDKPWAWAFSAYACAPPESRWIQDRHNLVDIFHDDMGLIAGGGNTKMQPLWSTFTVGDCALLTPDFGNANPDFTPAIPLKWTPVSAALDLAGPVSGLTLKCGGADCRVSVEPREDGALAVTYQAPADAGVEAHLPLMYRPGGLRLADGSRRSVGEQDLTLTAEEAGGHVSYGQLALTMPPGTRLVWPARQHNPYAKGGESSLSAAKLVLVMPFTGGRDEFTVLLSRYQEPPFPGQVFEARELPVRSDTGTRMKPLPEVGSLFLGAEKPGESMTFTLPAVEPGTYELFGEFVIANVYGILQVSIDGKPVGQPFDAYGIGVDGDGQRVSFGTVDLGEGTHEVKVEMVGRNEKAERHYISVKRWLLKPAKQG